MSWHISASITATSRARETITTYLSTWQKLTTPMNHNSHGKVTATKGKSSMENQFPVRNAQSTRKLTTPPSHNSFANALEWWRLSVLRSCVATTPTDVAIRIRLWKSGQGVRNSLKGAHCNPKAFKIRSSQPRKLPSYAVFSMTRKTPE